MPGQEDGSRWVGEHPHRSRGKGEEIDHSLQSACIAKQWTTWILWMFILLLTFFCIYFGDTHTYNCTCGGGQRTAFWSWFCPPTTWDLGIEFRHQAWWKVAFPTESSYQSILTALWGACMCAYTYDLFIICTSFQDIQKPSKLTQETQIRTFNQIPKEPEIHRV